MKHCPECEFTFDDEQQVCDFDGTELSVVPERLPSFKTVSFAPAGSGSFVRRLVKSRAGLPVLALAGVALSALLVGYYDSLSQGNIEVSNQTSKDTASRSKPTQVKRVWQVETKADRPRIISTLRRIGADELPSSMVKRLREGSHSRSANSRRDPSATKLIATKRGPLSSKLVGTKRKPANVSRQSQARNRARPDSRERVRQVRPESRERVRQQHSAAKASGQPRWNSTATVANRRLGANESTHHRKDPKVVAILKKTGSILKRPFKLIAGR